MQLNYDLTPKSYMKGLQQADLIFNKRTWRSHLIRALLSLPFICFILWWWITFFEQQNIIVEILSGDYESLDEFLNEVQQTNRWLAISTVILALVATIKLYFEITLPWSKAFGHYSPMLMNNRIELREKELFHQSDMGSTLSFYEKLYAVEQSKDFVLIFFDRGLVSHIIPKRAFADQAQVDEFISTIKSKLAPKHK